MCKPTAGTLIAVRHGTLRRKNIILS